MLKTGKIKNDVGGRFQKKVKLNGKNLNNTKYLGILFIFVYQILGVVFLQPTDIFYEKTLPVYSTDPKILY